MQLIDVQKEFSTLNHDVESQPNFKGVKGMMVQNDVTYSKMVAHITSLIKINVRLKLGTIAFIYENLQRNFSLGFKICLNMSSHKAWR